MSVSIEKIARLRMAIARLGEMDTFKWWNTKGMLSGIGELAVARGLPKTHVFARCRAVFAVAAHRTEEVFDPPNSYTLWRLPVEIEDRIEDAWSSWLEKPEPWKSFVDQLGQIPEGTVVNTLQQLGVISDTASKKIQSLRRSDDLRSVPLRVNGESPEEAIELLAGAHNCSEPGKLAVPFIREEDFPK